MTAPPPAAFALSLRAHRLAFPAPLLERLRASASFEPDRLLHDFGTSEARAVLATTEILISGWGCPGIDQQVLAAAPNLRAVVHAAGSVKKHIAPEVYARGIAVSSAARANASPVAEFTLAAMVFGSKDAFARARRYAVDTRSIVGPPPDRAGLVSSTVGVVGASHIGRLVIEQLRGFDVHVLLADPYLSPGDAAELGVELVALDELCRRSDIVSLHAPAVSETRGLIDDRRLTMMRDGALLINTARGSLVDTPALVRHCTTGRISAVLDVTDPEPLPPGHALFGLENVHVTPHLAGAEGDEVARLGEFAVAEVERFVQGKPLLGRVEEMMLPFIA